MALPQLANGSTSNDTGQYVYNSSFNTTGSMEFGFYDPLFEDMSSRAIMIIIYSIVFCSCFFGNLVVVIVVFRDKPQRTMTTVLLTNLAVSDIFVGVFCIYPNLLNFLLSSWKLGEVLCILSYYVQAVSYSVAVLTLMAMSVERYLAIIHPMTSRRYLQKRSLIVGVCAIWILSAALNVPHILIYKTTTIPLPNGESMVQCFMRYNVVNLQVYSTINFFLWFCAPLLILTACYARICVALVQSQTESPCIQGSCRERGSSVYNWVPQEIIRSRRRVIRLLIVMVLSFAITTMPYEVRLMLQNWGDFVVDSPASKMFTIFTFVFYYANSALHPLLYAFLSRRFRGSVRTTMCGCNSTGETDEQQQLPLQSLRSSLQKSKLTLYTPAEAAGW